MLRLDLNDLFTPSIIEAFQQQWTGSPDIALAQAEEAIRALVAPQDQVERYVAALVLNLVGPEPDGLAWLAAMAKGSFKLSDATTHVLGRAKENPAQAIQRQRSRIANLATSAKARGADGEEIRIAYNDALRLIVASSMLTQMRKGVAAKAALGAAWALMVGVSDYCTVADRRTLFLLGADRDLQRLLGDAVTDVLKGYREDRPDLQIPVDADFKGSLPPGVDPHAYFRTRSDDFVVQLRPGALSTGAVPFIRPPTKKELETASYRASLMMPALRYGCGDQTSQARIAFALALRAERRRCDRALLQSGNVSSAAESDHNVQVAIRDHVEAGHFFPVEIPQRFVAYLEEDVAWFYHQHGREWCGYEVWYEQRFLWFEPDPTKVDRLDI